MNLVPENSNIVCSSLKKNLHSYMEFFNKNHSITIAKVVYNLCNKNKIHHNNKRSMIYDKYK